MEMLLVSLLGLCALLGASAANPCLDPFDDDYGCEAAGNGVLGLSHCGITDDELVDDIASCFDDFGRENITNLSLSNNSLTSLPEDVFEDLPALTSLYLSENDLNTLTEDIFLDLTTLEVLNLDENALTTLPAGIFEPLTSLEYLNLDGNSLECLPTLSVELNDASSEFSIGLHVDDYGDECGCFISDATYDVCGGETCTPGQFGYICDSAVGTSAPDSSSEAPVGAIVGGVLGSVIVVGCLVLVALFKTGRIKTTKRDRSPSPAAAASGSASDPVVPQYPTIPQHPRAVQYPIKPQYPMIT